MLNNIQKWFWYFGRRAMVTQAIRGCIQCRRHVSEVGKQIMAPLQKCSGCWLVAFRWHGDWLCWSTTARCKKLAEGWSGRQNPASNLEECTSMMHTRWAGICPLKRCSDLWTDEAYHPKYTLIMAQTFWGPMENFYLGFKVWDRAWRTIKSRRLASSDK